MQTPGPPIRVLIAEDSDVTRALLSAIVRDAPGFQLAGAVSDGEAAVDAVARLRPSVVTMDLHMPNLDGVEATRRIMREAPTPIVVVTASSNVDGRSTYDALAAGALSVVARPVGPSDARYDDRRRALLHELRLMSGVRLVRRIDIPPSVLQPSVVRRSWAAGTTPIGLVAIGASTGGPAVLYRLLRDLPRRFEPAVLIVQHITEGFADGLALWLREAAPGPVHIPRDGDVIVPGHTYLAPDGHHMRVTRRSTISLTADPPIAGHRPSVTALFESVAEAYGRHAIGVILTGMGVDGVDGLVRIRLEGGVTVAQDAASSAVYGMPRAAVEAGAADRIVSLDALGQVIAALVAQGARRHRREG